MSSISYNLWAITLCIFWRKCTSLVRNAILIQGRISLSSQNSLNSSWHGFHKMLKILFWDSVPIWHNCIMKFLQICQLHILPFFHIPKVFYWIQIRWLRRPLKNIELILMFMKPLWDDFCSVTQLSCVIMLEVAIKRWVHCRDEGMKGCTWSETILKYWNAVAFKWRMIGINGPKVRKENIPHHYTPGV